MNFLKQTFDPCTSVAKKIVSSPLRSLLRSMRLEEGQVALDLPGRHGVVIIPPLLGLELDERLLELRPEHIVHERVRVEGLDGLEQRPRERLHTELCQLSVVEQVHVLRERLARIELV